MQASNAHTLFRRHSRVVGEHTRAALTSYLMKPVVEDRAIIHIPSTTPGVENQNVAATFSHSDRKSLILRTGEAVSESTTVTVQSDHLLFFGTVCSCVRDGDAKWRVDVRVERSIMLM